MTPTRPTASRRRFLAATGLTAAATIGLAGCSGAGSSTPAADGVADLQLTWWGNPTRNENTTNAIDAYTAANPQVRVTPQPGEWSSYWDRLATQTAGNTAPDIIQHEVGYVAEYAQRGALLKLDEHGIDVAAFAAGTADSGQVAGSLYGVNAGINTPVLLANPKVFEAAGVDLPDDTTWTWDELREIAAEVTAKGGDGVFGMTSMFSNDAYFGAFLRQDGKELFTEQGLGFTAADAAPWFELALSYVKAKALPGASKIEEESTKPLDQGALATAKAGLSPFWSNQVQAVNDASSDPMKILRFPSRSGKATERQAWYKAAMLWSVSARTQHPDAAIALVNWWINSTASADINLAERGIPANTDMLAHITPKLPEAQQGVAAFIADIQPEIGTSPIVVPPGGTSLVASLARHVTDVLFSKASPSDAAQAMVDEVSGNLTQ